ncbi:OmpA family protein [Spirosoma sp. SC4-14]|uniref:OmpA family protein n=1 Tax=Spirosoma sp. SC4-14 TaxID=3128900 RepID=UPI0030CBA0F5
MAVNLLDLAKAYLTNTVVNQVSNHLGESTTQTQTALNSVLPAVLGGIIQKASEPGGPSTIMNLIGQLTTPNRNTGEVIGSTNGVLGQLDDLINGKSGQFSSLLSVGSDLVSSLFGNKAASIAEAISSFSGVKQSSASSLMSLVSPILLSLIGKKMTDDGSGPVGLTNLLNSQAPLVEAAVPSGLASLLSTIPGLGLLGGLGAKLSNMTSAARESTATYKPSSVPIYNDDDDNRGNGNRWLPWLLLALGALALFFVLRSCQKDSTTTTSSAENSMGATVDSTASDVSAATDSLGSAVGAAIDSAEQELAEATAKLGSFFKHKLPSGVELNIPELGIENKLIQFIEDKNKPVDKTTWFNFDRLLFDTGKATLKPSSHEQLINMVEILKAYPQVDLKLGGYTDNTGSAVVNKKLSQDRADAVKSELVKRGIAASRLDAEGYGQEHPVASNATAEGRAQNRRIAVRVTKK